MECSASTLDLFEDVGSAGRPDEGFGIFVVAVDVTADRHEAFFQIAKHTAPQSVLSEVAEETLHHVEPRRTGGGEVHVESGAAREPALHLGMLMRRVVVADQV